MALRQISHVETHNCRDRIAFIVNVQNKLQMTCDKKKMAKDFSVVLEVPRTLEAISSIIDYTLNISFRSVDFRWLKAPKSNARFESTVALKVNEAAEELFRTLIIAYFEGDAFA